MTERLSSCPSSVLTLPIITSTCITNVTSTSTLTHWTSTNVTIKEVEERAQEFVKNLTIDSKNTSAYFRSKTSAKDDRPSAMHMGLVGIVVVVVPMVLIILVDLKKIVLDIRSYDNLFKK
ncbi:hypothetical protein DPMN_092372 [Dreissena polymorpha]|uniref:Uncharacterized protein n=2 Tax=Dreissena polymorpha TaxID=45954 RepID=A0A9D4L177_DREPO|nr:hypothetical protein DPMN_092372 [Dreissena polymorpha]